MYPSMLSRRSALKQPLLEIQTSVQTETNLPANESKAHLLVIHTKMMRRNTNMIATNYANHTGVRDRRNEGDER